MIQANRNNSRVANKSHWSDNKMVLLLGAQSVQPTFQKSCWQPPLLGRDQLSLTTRVYSWTYRKSLESREGLFLEKKEYSTTSLSCLRLHFQIPIFYIRTCLFPGMTSEVSPSLGVDFPFSYTGVAWTQFLPERPHQKAVKWHFTVPSMSISMILRSSFFLVASSFWRVLLWLQIISKALKHTCLMCSLRSFSHSAGHLGKWR